MLIPDLGAAIEADAELRLALLQDPGVKRSLRGRGADATVPARITAAFWHTLYANLVRARYDAEIVLLPRAPFAWALPGPTTYLEVAANLNLPARLVVPRLEASQVAALVSAPFFDQLVVAGAAPSSESGTAPLIVGRALDPREHREQLSGLPAAELPHQKSQHEYGCGAE